MKLIKLTKNWADEFDVYGSRIMTEEKWNKIVKLAENYFNQRSELEDYFGTNEAITFRSFEDWKSAFSVMDITVKESVILTTYGFNDFGYTYILEEETYFI